MKPSEEWKRIALSSRNPKVLTDIFGRSGPTGDWRPNPDSLLSQSYASSLSLPSIPNWITSAKVSGWPLTSLSNVPLAQSITQRQAKLLKKGNLYSWRSVLWISAGADIKPWIWQARILREDKSFRTVAVELEPYETGKAHSLELFDDVSIPPARAN